MTQNLTFNRNYPAYIPQSVINLVERDFPASYVEWSKSITGSALKGLAVWEKLIHESGMATVWAKINELSAQDLKYDNLAVAILEAARIAEHDYAAQQAEAVELAQVFQKIQDQAATLRKSIKQYQRLAGTPQSHVLKSGHQILYGEKIFEILNQSDSALEKVGHTDLLTTAKDENGNHITAALKTRQRGSKNDFLRGFLHVLVHQYGIMPSYQLSETVIPTVTATVLEHDIEPDPAEIRRLWSDFQVKQPDKT